MTHEEPIPTIAALTPRECEVMAAIATGLTARRIASQLGISHRTIDIHRTNAIEKLGAQNSAHAAVIFDRAVSGRLIAAGEGQSIQPILFRDLVS